MFAMLVAAAALNVLSPTASGVFVAEQPDRAAAAAGTRAQVEAMKKLEWLVGDWEGPAKFNRGGPEWMTLTQREAVKTKMGGRVLLIEGTGLMGEGEAQRTAFEALAVVSFDPASMEYKMRAFGPEGAADPKIEVGENSIVWSFEVHGMRSRYTVTRDEKGRWNEVGERSTDEGKTWVKFVEMALEKKK